MTRTVKDAAYWLEAISGIDPADNYTSAIPDTVDMRYVSACRISGLAGARIGIPRNLMAPTAESSDQDILDAFDEAIATIQDAGAEVVDYINMPAYDEFVANGRQAFYGVLCADFVSGIADYLSKLEKNPQAIHSQADIREFTHKYPLEDYPSKDTTSWDLCLEAGINNTSPAFWPLHQQNQRLFNGDGGFLRTLQRHNLDAFVLPTNFASEVPFLVGSPVITVPLGFYKPGTDITLSPLGDANLVLSGPGIP
jgi:amidase